VLQCDKVQSVTFINEFLDVKWAAISIRITNNFVNYPGHWDLVSRKITRLINAETENAPYILREDLRTSNLVERWSTMIRNTDVHVDVKGQRSKLQHHVVSLTCVCP